MDTRLDMIIKDGYVVLEDRMERLDIGIQNGMIVCLRESVTKSCDHIIDASGLTVVPGMLDVHVHLNEPGLAEWEGIPTGSAALAAGGCTTYFDMPLNCLPPTTTTDAFMMKAEMAKHRSFVDYAFWGGLVPGNLEQLAPLAEAGVIGYKAFMSEAGGKQEGAFREVDEETLFSGMIKIAEQGKILALHAESDPVIRAIASYRQGRGMTSARDYLDSRPVYAETEAVRRGLYLARLAGCPLHFVHISSPEAVEIIQDAKRSGMDVSLETCPHYLMLTEQALNEIGPRAKCAPPLRTEKEREGLWQAVSKGDIDMISSDHSPCLPEWKQSDDWFEIWGGIAGAQSSLEIVLGEGHVCRGIELPLLCRLLATNPARRFGLYPKKGVIAEGADADLVMVDFSTPYELEIGHLHDRHKLNPYVGNTMYCRVEKTLLRGIQVYDRKSGFNESPQGRMLVAQTPR